MNIPVSLAEPDAVAARLSRHPLPGQVVLVLQGGGALGAYQVGVFRAMHEAGIEPDWVIGTSIGAINASLIAGNAPEHRLDRMHEFWNRVSHSAIKRFFATTPFVGPAMANWLTITQGVGPFFQPNPLAHFGPIMRLRPDNAGYYSTASLRETLRDLVDFDRVNLGDTRLTVGAAAVRTGQMRYFDSRDALIDVRHVMASGGRPPAFPAVRVDGDLYWDGGILSNTPVEAVFDDNPRRDAVVFAVHLWNPDGTEPDFIWQVLNRHKDIQYSSRAISHIQRQRQIHKLRHIIKELAMRLPEEERSADLVREMEAYGCFTQMHVIRLQAPSLRGEGHQKDIDFSTDGIRQRSAAGYSDTMRILSRAPWEEPHDPLEGFILHNSLPE